MSKPILIAAGLLLLTACAHYSEISREKDVWFDMRVMGGSTLLYCRGNPDASSGAAPACFLPQFIEPPKQMSELDRKLLDLKQKRAKKEGKEAK